MPIFNNLREKLSWQIALAVVLYVVIVGSLVFYGLSFHMEKQKTMAAIVQDEKLEQTFLRALEKRPLLEQEQTQLAAELWANRREIPVKSDIPLVVKALGDLVTGLGMELLELDYRPVGHTQEPNKFSFSLVAEGDHGVLTLVSFLGQALPTLAVQNLEIGGIGENRLRISMLADLYVAPDEAADGYSWQGIVPNSPPKATYTGFGVPFAAVKEFYSDQYKVLGIVSTARENHALLSVNGTQKWFKAGDELAHGRITDVMSTGIIIDLAGVKI
ncbi:MAG: hypothetical protein GX316_08775, partial [Firmicutes bacterium]|nr:hypothetical protein [Bacillota bacterium]